MRDPCRLGCCLRWMGLLDLALLLLHLLILCRIQYSLFHLPVCPLSLQYQSRSHALAGGEVDGDDQGQRAKVPGSDMILTCPSHLFPEPRTCRPFPSLSHPDSRYGDSLAG